MPRLIWVFAGRTVILLVLSWGGSNACAQTFSRARDVALCLKLPLAPYEPPHDKTNKMTFAPSEDSDQPGHPPSLISVFTCAHWVAKVAMFVHAESEGSDQTGRAHMSFCWFCREVALLLWVWTVKALARLFAYVISKYLFLMADSYALKQGNFSVQSLPQHSCTYIHVVEKQEFFQRTITVKLFNFVAINFRVL